MTRFAYLDESGTGNPKFEPFLVVAGFIVDADSQWKQLERYLSDMADDFALPEDRAGFVFHAKDLRHGSEDFRRRYSKEKRHAFLQALCEIPQRFAFPVVVAAVDREAAAKRWGSAATDKAALIAALQVATGACAATVDEYMSRYAGAEVAMLVYEQNGSVSKDIREYHNLLRHPVVNEWAAAQPHAALRTLERVVDTAMFGGKSDSSPLQVADACAYVLCRRMRRAIGDEQFFQPLRRQLLREPSRLFADLAAEVDGANPQSLLAHRRTSNE